MKKRLQITNLLRELAIGAIIFVCCVSRGADCAVFPIATDPATVELGASGAFGNTNSLVAIQASTNINAKLVSSNGPTVGPPISLGQSMRPQINVAFGKTNYLVTWLDDFINSGPNIFGQFISQSGAKVGSTFTVSQGAGTNTSQRNRALAFDGKNFLSLWHDTIGTSYTLYGQFISQAGALVGSPLVVGSLGNDGTDAILVFDGTNYLAAWSSLRQGTPAPQRDINARIISTNGTFVTAVFLVSQTTSLDRNGVAVAFDGTNYLCVWSRDAFVPPVTWSINGRLISRSGTPLGSELTLASSMNETIFPGISFDGSDYLLSWGEIGATNSNIEFQFLNRAAQAIGPAFTPFASVGTNQPLIGFAAFDGTRFAALGNIGAVDNSGQFLSSDLYGLYLPSSTAQPTLYPVLPKLAGQFHMRLSGTPGINYALQEKTALSNTVWTILSTNTPTNGCTFDYVDTSATNQQRFYRALKQ